MPIALMATAGSSPHTRGARLSYGVFHTFWRIIPAYAGSTKFWQFLATRSRDHPRIRGEHRICWNRILVPRGSSPHTRGAPAVRPLHRRRSRIIPAYAGSTRPGPRRTALDRDHPRIRGEHYKVEGGKKLRPGSSPHTRGALPGHDPTADRSRIIPAYAGSTVSVFA